MNKIELSARLGAIAQLVPKGTVVADVGTDHGYLICWLAEKGIVAKGYACDINEMPLQRAEKLIGQHGLSSMVETLLTNGLIGLEDKQLDIIMIAGMGGELISNIIDAAPWVKEQQVRMILQPMTRDHKLRQYLYQHGFSIVDEHAVLCGKFAYTAMVVEHTGATKELTPHEAWSGRLWEKTDELSLAYLQSKLVKLKNMEPSFEQRDGYADMLNEWKERLD